jgi:hypothetical protein
MTASSKLQYASMVRLARVIVRICEMVVPVHREPAYDKKANAVRKIKQRCNFEDNIQR